MQNEEYLNKKKQEKKPCEFNENEGNRDDNRDDNEEYVNEQDISQDIKEENNKLEESKKNN